MHAPETNGSITLRFNDGPFGEVSAWVEGDPRYVTEMLVGVWTPGESWIAKYGLRDGSVRFDHPAIDLNTWKNFVRLVHLYI